MFLSTEAWTKCIWYLFFTGRQCRFLRMSGRAFQFWETLCIYKRLWQHSYGTGYFCNLLLRHRRRNAHSENLRTQLLPEWEAVSTQQWNRKRLHQKICQGTGKKITLSAKCQITDKRTCKVFDLSSPLLYHGAVGCVRSVKDCLWHIGFVLFLDLTIIHHYKSFPTISKRISYCLLNDSIVCPPITYNALITYRDKQTISLKTSQFYPISIFTFHYIPLYISLLNGFFQNCYFLWNQLFIFFYPRQS